MNKIDYDRIPGIGEIRSLHGPYDEAFVHKNTSTLAEKEAHKNKIVESLEKAVALSGLKDGMTIS
ncbi:MAG: hypothetical protein LBN36_05105, partial [Clostridiales Family XIII bacterium]|nr:hypothetical protein [Clostridiales Family XIII bacterium]